MSANIERNEFWANAGRQLRRPRGKLGWVLGHLMSVINWKPYQLAIGKLEISASDAVLELGFGSGRGLKYLLELVPSGTVAAVDHSDVMLDMARRKNADAVRSHRLLLHQGSFSPLPYANDSFDHIVLVNVTYFFDRAGCDMGECYRVLKPGGQVVVYVTERKTMETWPFCENQTHRTFDRADAVKMMKEAGFPFWHVASENVTLPFGIHGLIITAMK
ncbi:class I SAM-dependent methyltransferase (plasmid) [Rhizobium ruizarguesonis]|uniref:Methyltransferase type 11 domain-containing protein n=2 Tax=Rhizobium TaxID=379 RepID=A0A179C0E8_RHILE|nr:class I SAM-dependent methyltransferase [Rhizobium leguminosarum]OAP97550.1 hypothetical protein A4U53_36700 [Rhizobium leguminosarum]